MVLDYMYYGQITFHDDKLRGLITAANYLRMEELKTRCTGQVAVLLSPENVLSWLEVQDKLDIDQIKSQCTNIMVSHFTEISKQADFLDMTFAEIHEYFSNVLSSKPNHDGMLSSAMRWVNHDVENRKMHLEDLIHQTQLDKCSLQAVLDVMETYGPVIASNISVYNSLTKAVVQNLSKKGSSLSLTAEATAKPTLTLVAGHVDEELKRTCWSLNESKQFKEMCKITFAEFATDHSVCKIPMGFAIAGGQQSDLCIVYNISTKSWSNLQRLLRKRHGHSSICINSVIYVFGGFISGNESKSVDSLELDGGSWQKNPDLGIPVQYPQVASIKLKVYLLDAANTKQFFVFNTEKNIWNELAPVPVKGCNGVSMTSVNGKVYIAGSQFNVCAFYNTDSNTWCEVQGPSLEHFYGTMVFHENKLLLLGGRESDVIEEYSLEDDNWSVSSMKLPDKLWLFHGLVLDIPQED